MSHVPTIDLSAPSPAAMDALDAALRDHGFFLMTGHGADDLIDRTWAETERFFDAGPEVHEPLRRTFEQPLGFFDRELTKRKRDNKIVFDYTDPATPDRDAFNRWPDNLDGFRDTMAEFHHTFSTIAQRTAGLLHDVLGLGDESRDQLFVDPTSSTVRLNHYPVGDAVPEAERADLVELGETALGYHTDPGTLTLLLQDDTGGLQTQARNGEWIDVAPSPGTIVVNLADAVQVQTNDRWRAAVHRVVPMTAKRRFSIPYFGNPRRSAVVAPLPEMTADEPRYHSFRWTDFMRARTEDNFEDLGAADTQISDYLINAGAST